MTYFAARTNLVGKVGKWVNSGYFRNYCRQWPENLYIKASSHIDESAKRRLAKGVKL